LTLSLKPASRKYAAVLLAALTGAAAAAFSVHAQPQAQPQPSAAQPPAPSATNSKLVFLDPAHGASDSGATLAGHAQEKDVTLAIAARLRTALTAAGFTVIASRDSDPSDPITADQRAEAANRARAVACVVIHATDTGSGVHIYTSTLQPLYPEPNEPDYPAAFVPTPWDTAQAAFISRSQTLAAAFTAGLGNAHLASLTGRAPLRPLDNLMCPAVAIELSPLLAPGVDSTPVTDAAYQRQVATALATSLSTWREQSAPSATADADSHEAAQRAIAAAESAARAATRARARAAAASNVQSLPPAPPQKAAQ
jgi:N-acetylmuramoyl-L-alanine amidase